MFPAFKKLRLSKADAQAASAAPLPKRPDGDMAGLLSAMAANRFHAPAPHPSHAPHLQQ